MCISSYDTCDLYAANVYAIFFMCMGVCMQSLLYICLPHVFLVYLHVLYMQSVFYLCIPRLCKGNFIYVCHVYTKCILYVHATLMQSVFYIYAQCILYVYSMCM